MADSLLLAPMAAAPAGVTILIPAIGPDGALYPIEKLKAHQQGVLHQAISVFVFCGGRLLIQQRAQGKYHCGGQWANTCCTHPHWGEGLEESAARRLREELGAAAPLRPARIIEYAAAVSDGLYEHERVQVFEGAAATENIPLAPDPAEVAAIRWESPAALRAEARAQPERFAPWFRIYLNRWAELGLSVG